MSTPLRVTCLESTAATLAVLAIALAPPLAAARDASDVYDFLRGFADLRIPKGEPAAIARATGIALTDVTPSSDGRRIQGTVMFTKPLAFIGGGAKGHAFLLELDDPAKTGGILFIELAANPTVSGALGTPASVADPLALTRLSLTDSFLALASAQTPTHRLAIEAPPAWLASALESTSALDTARGFDMPAGVRIYASATIEAASPLHDVTEMLGGDEALVPIYLDVPAKTLAAWLAGHRDGGASLAVRLPRFANPDFARWFDASPLTLHAGVVNGALEPSIAGVGSLKVGTSPRRLDLSLVRIETSPGEHGWSIHATPRDPKLPFTLADFDSALAKVPGLSAIEFTTLTMTKWPSGITLSLDTRLTLGPKPHVPAIPAPTLVGKSPDGVVFSILPDSIALSDFLPGVSGTALDGLRLASPAFVYAHMTNAKATTDVTPAELGQPAAERLADPRGAPGTGTGGGAIHLASGLNFFAHVPAMSLGFLKNAGVSLSGAKSLPLRGALHTRALDRAVTKQIAAAILKDLDWKVPLPSSPRYEPPGFSGQPLAFSQPVLEIKGTDTEGTPGIEVELASTVKMKLGQHSFSFEGAIALEEPAGDYVFVGAMTKPWERVFGADWLTLTKFELSAGEKNDGGKKAFAIDVVELAATIAGTSYAATGEIDLEDKAVTSVTVTLKSGRFDLDKLGGLNKLPGADKFAISDLSVSRTFSAKPNTTITGRAEFLKQPVTVTVFGSPGDGWNLAFGLENLALFDLFPELPKSIAHAITFQKAVLIVAERSGAEIPEPSTPPELSKLLATMLGEHDTFVLGKGLNLVAVVDRSTADKGPIEEGLEAIGAPHTLTFRGTASSAGFGGTATNGGAAGAGASGGIDISAPLGKIALTMLPKFAAPKLSGSERPELYLRWVGQKVDFGVELRNIPVTITERPRKNEKPKTLEFTTDIRAEITESGPALNASGTAENAWNEPLGIRGLSILGQGEDAATQPGPTITIDVGATQGVGIGGRAKIGNREIDVAACLTLEAGVPIAAKFYGATKYISLADVAALAVKDPSKLNWAVLDAKLNEPVLAIAMPEAGCKIPDLPRGFAFPDPGARFSGNLDFAGSTFASIDIDVDAAKEEFSFTIDEKAPPVGLDLQASLSDGTFTLAGTVDAAVDAAVDVEVGAIHLPNSEIEISKGFRVAKSVSGSFHATLGTGGLIATLGKRTPLSFEWTKNATLSLPKPLSIDLGTKKLGNIATVVGDQIVQDAQAIFGETLASALPTAPAIEKGKDLACPKKYPGSFPVGVGTGECWTCASGGIRNPNPLDPHAMLDIRSKDACTRTETKTTETCTPGGNTIFGTVEKKCIKSTSHRVVTYPASYDGKPFCPGQIADEGSCWVCPDKMVRGVAAITSGQACIKPP